MIEVIFCDSDGNNIHSIVLKVAHIECKKDTYDILRDTIAPKLNDSLKELQSSKAMVTERTTINGKVSVSVKLRPDNYIDDNNDNTSVVKFRIFITGDLAFYAAVLGKINMAGDW